MQGLQIMHEAQPLQKLRGHGHGPVDAPAALLQAFEHQHAVRRIDAVGGQRQGFRDPAAAMSEGATMPSGMVAGTATTTPP